MKQQTAKKLPHLLDQIRSQYDQLSKRLRQVADFVLQSPSGVAFGTVATLSKQAEVHPSTWVRFANTFGFNGFSEMQTLFKNNLMEEVPNYQERVRSIKDKQKEKKNGQSVGLSAAGLLADFAHANALALDDLATSVTEDDLKKTIHILMNAKSSYVMGVRRAFVVASYFAYALQHIDQKAHLINGIGGMYDEQMSNFDHDDALIAVSFYPYASETQYVADDAIKKGMPLVVITDNPLSPLAQMSTVSLVVKEAEIHNFRSLSSSLVLAQSLSIALAYELEAKKEES